ncbi:MAG TPA: hypothetical protein DEQ47_04125 [Solibacterales bacterium]|jgi:hypothetical protein|nr:hypothetical protein [Bryobacterales bacterium]
MKNSYQNRLGEGASTRAYALEDALSKDLASVAQVRHVLTHQLARSLLVWIALDDCGSDVRKRIYQKELELISEFPDVEFDFNLVPALGRDAGQIATDAHVVYSRMMHNSEAQLRSVRRAM